MCPVIHPIWLIGFLFCFVGVFLFVFVLKKMSHYVAQTGLEFTATLLLQPPKCRDYMYETPHLSGSCIFEWGLCTLLSGPQNVAKY